MNRQHSMAPLLLALAVPRRSRPRPLAAGERHGTDLFAGYSFAKIDDVEPPRRQPGRWASTSSARSPASWTRASHWGSDAGREPQRPDADGRARRALRQARRDGLLRARAGGPGAGQGVDRRARRGHLASRRAELRRPGRRRRRLPHRGDARRAGAGRLLWTTPARRASPARGSELRRRRAAGRADSASRPASSTASGARREGQPARRSSWRPERPSPARSPAAAGAAPRRPRPRAPPTPPPISRRDPRARSWAWARRSPASANLVGGLQTPLAVTRVSADRGGRRLAHLHARGLHRRLCPRAPGATLDCPCHGSRFRDERPGRERPGRARAVPVPRADRGERGRDQHERLTRRRSALSLSPSPRTERAKPEEERCRLTTCAIAGPRSR